MKLFACLCSLLIGAGIHAQQTIDRVVAVVGDQPVLFSDIENQYNQLAQQSQTPLPDDTRCKIFDNLLLEKLFVAQAQIDSITVSDEEVSAELDRKIRYFTAFFGSREKLEEYYGRSIMQMKDDFRSDVENQLVADKMKGRVLSGLKVSPAEVKAYFNSIPPDSIPYFNAELELAQIVMFPKLTDAEKELALKKIEKIKREIESGTDFSLQAILYSEDPGSASEGGNLGFIGRGELVPEFEGVAFKLKEGEMSGIVETPFGYHLIITDEVRGNKRKVRHILIRPKTTTADLVLVKKTMDSLAVELQAGRADWREAVNRFSDDEQSKSMGGIMTNPKTGTQFFEKSEIDGSLIFTLDRMKVGQFSEALPFSQQDRTGEMKQGYRIIFLKSETKPHKANLLTDYARIQQNARETKTQAELEKWISIYKDKNYFRIDESMLHCPQTAKWLKRGF